MSGAPGGTRPRRARRAARRPGPSAGRGGARGRRARRPAGAGARGTQRGQHLAPVLPVVPRPRGQAALDVLAGEVADVRGEPGQVGRAALDHHVHGLEGVRFYTRLKTVTARWPGSMGGGTDYVIPTLE